MLHPVSASPLRPHLRSDARIITLILGSILLASCAGRGATATSESPTSSTSRPPAGTVPPGAIRTSAIAGSWYPADPQELATLIDGLLAASPRLGGDPIALIVPHAGYAYSGPVAAQGFKQLEGASVDVAVILATDHQAPLSDPIAVWDQGAFETPLGLVPVDTDLARALIEANPLIRADIEAHQAEHVIEIELPFLQRVCPGCKIVPVLMGADDQATIQALVQALAAVLPGRRAVIIASSDLSHYAPFEQASSIDASTLAAIETGQPSLVRDTITGLMASGVPNLITCACGEAAILVAMQAAQALDANIITTLSYANSGHSPYGDTAQVVGYGAVMFWRYEAPQYTSSQKEELLSAARQAIAGYLETGSVPQAETTDELLNRRSGAFVTLEDKGELRGCIGQMQPLDPLYQIVRQMAVEAAVSDPRFPPVSMEELDQLRMEISVLSPLQRLTELEDIEVGTHGLLLIKFGQQGVFLPQVAVEEGWDREALLDNLCGKAGLPPACWREEPTLYTFTAIVFGED